MRSRRRLRRRAACGRRCAPSSAVSSTARMLPLKPVYLADDMSQRFLKGNVFPDSQHCPGRSTKHLVRAGVASAVTLQLVPPPVGVRLGHAPMLATAVPEASIHEDGQPYPGEGDVHLAPDIGQCAVVNPISIAHHPEGTTQCHFRLRVAFALQLHPAALEAGGLRMMLTPEVPSSVPETSPRRLHPGPPTSRGCTPRLGCRPRGVTSIPYAQSRSRTHPQPSAP